jgi:hypothetical protein
LSLFAFIAVFKASSAFSFLPVTAAQVNIVREISCAGRSGLLMARAGELRAMAQLHSTVI